MCLEMESTDEVTMAICSACPLLRVWSLSWQPYAFPAPGAKQQDKWQVGPALAGLGEWSGVEENGIGVWMC